MRAILGAGAALAAARPYTATFQFAAESGPLGQDAHGFYHQVLSTPDGQVGEVTGKVTCLIVTGNVATIGGVWLTSTGLPRFEPGWADFPGSCATPLWTDPLGLGPLATGHIVVHEAPVTPLGRESARVGALP